MTQRQRLKRLRWRRKPTSRGRDPDDVWDCIAVFAPDANTEGHFKVDVYERFNADYREFARVMDRAIPNPKALPYVGRLARLTEIRAYARAHFLQGGRPF